MSLINQVLRDLDQRRAVTAAAPAAVKTSFPPAAPSALQRARRWGLGIAITATAVVAGGVAQGSIDWPGRTATPAAAVTPMPAAVVDAAPVVPPVVAAVPVAVAPPEVPPAARSEAPSPVAPVLLAVAAPTVRSPLISSPRSEPKARPIVTAAPAAPTAALAAPKLEPRIDKRMASRTPQERAEAHYQRGVTAHQAGQINDSADAFMAALREDARFAPARQAQAGLLIGQSRHDEALALLHEGIALSPQQPTLALMLARLQAERQDLSAAADTLKAASGNATNNAEYQGFHAAILQRAGRHGEAAEKFSAALRLAPANSVWWMGLGISLAASDQSAAAREAFMRAKTTGALPPEAGQYVELRLRQML
ncbi:MAG: tetratricopeptide repeat protein [Rhizobacter sp.]|nr:tetratricopeptide repeat protein [Rhizobacter sp.]